MSGAHGTGGSMSGAHGTGGSMSGAHGTGRLMSGARATQIGVLARRSMLKTLRQPFQLFPLVFFPIILLGR